MVAPKYISVLFFLAINIFLLNAFTPDDAFAANNGDRDVIREEKNLEDVKKQIRETEAILQKINKKEASILGEFEKLNKELNKRKRAVKKIEKEIKGVDRNISKKRKSIVKLTKEKQSLEDDLETRLKAMYKMRGGLAYLTLLGTDSFNDFQRNRTYLETILKSDEKALIKLDKHIKALNSEERELAQLIQRLKKSKVDRKRKRVEAQSQANLKKSVLKKVKSEKKQYKKLAGELKDAQKGLSKLIKGLRGKGKGSSNITGFSKLKGRLKMPVRGKIITRYGKVKHPEFKTVTFNNGIEIKAKYGASVRTVYGGSVAFIGWLRGYGEVMIVDNGGGFYTLYAYLSESLKEKGDAVKKGDVIAKVGEKGTGDGAALYFEIREKGVPRDPEPWLAKR